MGKHLQGIGLMDARPLQISLDEIVALNVKSIELFGGSLGRPKLGCLEQCCGNAELAEQYSGNEDGSLGICFIGALMFYLIKDHCFVDGNKRTGLAVALKLLYDLGLTLDVSESELADYCDAIAGSRVTRFSDVVHWLASHLIQDGLPPTE